MAQGFSQDERAAMLAFDRDMPQGIVEVGPVAPREPARPAEPPLTDEDYRRAARAILTSDDTVDAEAPVSRGADDGVYVQAQVWVPNEWARELRRESGS